jgi:hypothetical protein
MGAAPLILSCLFHGLVKLESNVLYSAVKFFQTAQHYRPSCTPDPTAQAACVCQLRRQQGNASVSPNSNELHHSTSEIKLHKVALLRLQAPDFTTEDQRMLGIFDLSTPTHAVQARQLCYLGQVLASTSQCLQSK